eukprot:760079-Hanusia_phi.AAC.1
MSAAPHRHQFLKHAQHAHPGSALPPCCKQRPRVPDWSQEGLQQEDAYAHGAVVLGVLLIVLHLRLNPVRQAATQVLGPNLDQLSPTLRMKEERRVLIVNRFRSTHDEVCSLGWAHLVVPFQKLLIALLVEILMA